jgi:heavy metal sensor kinase
MRLRPRHVRTRLTLWYVGVLSAVLAVYIASTLLFMRVSLHRQLDEGLRAEFGHLADRLTSGSDGTVSVAGHAEGTDPGSVAEVWSPSGELLYRSPRLGTQVLGRPDSTISASGSIGNLTLGNGTPLRVLSQPHAIGGRNVVVRVGVSEENLHHEWRELLTGIVFGLPAAILIAGLAGHWLARRALSPLERMASHAEKLTADNLGERLPVGNPDDELGQMARAFNLSLARIEASFAQLRRFTADASHELRTPLTAIRAVGEVALQDRHEADHYRDAIGSMLEEVDRLSHLVGSLLVLSRADTGVALRRQDVALLDLTRESAALLEILAEEKGQRIDVHGDPSVRADGDKLILRRALINLIDNAIKYSPRGGSIGIDVRRAPDGRSVIEVSDEGPGIPEAHRSKVFERFYRVDKARSRDEGGAGLGLSIALWAVKAHGGEIEVSSEEGKGSTFRVILPAETSPPSEVGAARETGEAGRERIPKVSEIR